MKSLKLGIAFLLALVMLFGATGVASAATNATATPKPSQTLVPAKVDGEVEGTVLQVEDNDIIINMDNGNTIMFMLNYLDTTDAVAGDKVKIEYSGSVLDAPEAVTITVTEKIIKDQTLSGTIMTFDDNRLFVKISSENVFGFVKDKRTVVSGARTTLADDDEVTVTYTGELNGIPYAAEINITKAAAKAASKGSSSKSSKTTNKTLDGHIDALSSTSVTVHTNSGKLYTFGITSSTKVTGNYTMEVGGRIRVTYDGYASNSPNAKAIKVLSPNDPTPVTPVGPTMHTISGMTVISYDGETLEIANGSQFDCREARISGTGSGAWGDTAKITYYTAENGVNYATKIVFSMADYEQHEQFDPDPEYDPDGGFDPDNPVVY